MASGFLWEALLLPTKNPKLFLPLYLLLLLSSFLPTLVSTNIKQVSKELLLFLALYLLASFVLSVFLRTIIVFATSTTYTGELLTLRELLKKAKSEAKGPLITQLLASFLSIACAFIFLVPLVMALVILRNVDPKTSLILLVSVTLVILLAVLPLYLYLFVVWSVGMVVSVAEPVCYGMNAIGRATRLVKGKKQQVFVLVLILAVVLGGNSGLSWIVTKDVPADATALKMVLQLLVVSLAVAMDLFYVAAATTLYYVCKEKENHESYGELVEGEKSNYGVEYTKLPSVDVP